MANKPHSMSMRDDGGARDGAGSLDDALDHLERMLRQREGAGAPAGQRAPRARLAGDQYTIPLLDDVVVPGTETPGAGMPSGRHEAFADPAFIERDAECQEVIHRLCNEIEVIIQSGVEEALRSANVEIMERVKKHVEITLPELLEAIADIRARRS